MGRFPSAELKPFGPWRARLMTVLWWAFFILAGVAIFAGAWRTAEEYSDPRVMVVGWFETGRLAAYTLVALLYAAVAFLLRRRRPDDRVFMRMSFVFLLMLHYGPGVETFWRWQGLEGAGDFLAFIGLMLLITTMPAYPTGVYVPSAARWIRVAVPVAVIGAFVVALWQPPDGDVDWFTTLMLALLGTGLGLLVMRYLRMPRGLEKQQVKWAVFGLSVGLLMFTFEDFFPHGSPTSDTDEVNWAIALLEVVTVLGFGLIPAGVAASLLEYRLNDADAAVGKSLGYAIVTVIVGAAWTIIQAVLTEAAKQWVNTPAMTAAISAMLAALVITPARNYVLSWTERRFQPALVRLRKLPEKLGRWQTCSAPEELAELTLSDLVPGVGAAYAAILGDDGHEWRVLAARGVDPEQAMAQLSADGAPKPDPFPIRIELADQIGRPDVLAIGPRSDCASFTNDEKSAIAMIVGPLSNALQTSALRTRHTFKVEKSLAGIDTRLSKIEAGLGAASGPGASRRSPTGSRAGDRSSPT